MVVQRGGREVRPVFTREVNMQSQIEERCRQLAETGIAYGAEAGIPWVVPADPFALTPGERDALEQAGVDCARFLEAAHGAIVANDAVGEGIVKTLGMDAVRAGLSRLSAGYASSVPMVRPDMFWDKDGRLTAVEIETMIGGLGMCEAMRAAYGRSLFRGTADAYARMVRALVAEWSDATGFRIGDPLEVVAVNPASKAGYDAEFAVFSRALESHGIRFRVARPAALSIEDGAVFVDGIRVDVVHRFFRLSEFPEGSPELATLLRVARECLACVVQPWKEVLEEKALYAFFHEPSLRGYWIDRLGSATFSRLASLLPQTWLVGPDNDSLVAKLLDSERMQRPYWLKKSGSSWGGREAIDGMEMTTGKWRSALEIARAGYGRGNVWVLQERRVCRPHAFTVMENNVVLKRPMNLRVSPYCFLDGKDMRLADVLLTARGSTKVHGARDAIMVPAQVV